MSVVDIWPADSMYLPRHCMRTLSSTDIRDSDNVANCCTGCYAMDERMIESCNCQSIETEATVLFVASCHTDGHQDGDSHPQLAY